MDSRPPPPGAPPRYAFVTKVYRRNLRPVVLAVAFLGGFWALFSGVGYFRNAPIYNSNGSGKLGTFSIIVGILYMVGMVIEAFGIYAAASQKLPFVRTYAWGSILSALIVIAVGLIQIVIHFTLKNDIINTCANVNNGDTIIFTSWWGPIHSDTLDLEEARDWCNRAWNRDSWSVIIGFLITSFLAIFFTMIAFNYYHQLLDPTSAANVSREPNWQHRMGNFPSHYNPPYNPSGAPYGGPSGPGYYSYPAPPGPPPNQSSDAFVAPYDGKPPGYTGGDGAFAGYGDRSKKDMEADYDAPERDVTSPKTTNPFR